MNIAYKMECLSELFRASKTHPQKNFLSDILNHSELITLLMHCTTPSIQTIFMPDYAIGRALILDLIETAFPPSALVCCLTTFEPDMIPDTIFNYYDTKQPSLSLSESIELDGLNHHLVDFIWIEMTEQLEQELSDQQATVFDMLNFKQKTPVLVVRYK